MTYLCEGLYRKSDGLPILLMADEKYHINMRQLSH